MLKVSGEPDASWQGAKVAPDEWRSLPLRAHELLADAPLHDVWRMRLAGGGPNRTVREAIELFADVEGLGLGLTARTLFGLRKALGRVFGWDREAPAASSRTYVNRLSPQQRADSLDEPGSKRGFWTSVFTFEREALAEVINRTVHALLLFALEPAGDGYTLYMAIYVKPVSRFTAVYMALIDPFRRCLIYPALIKRFEQAWRKRWERSRQGRGSGSRSDFGQTHVEADP